MTPDHRGCELRGLLALGGLQVRRATAPPARRRAGRPAGGWPTAGGAPADALVGLGRGRSTRSRCPRRPLALLREELGADARERARRVELDDVRLPAPALPEARAERWRRPPWGEERVRDDRVARVDARRRARAIPTWCGSARATARAHRTPWSRPGPRPRWPPCCAACARGGRGGGAVRRRHERGGRGGGRCAAATRRRSRSTCRGWTACSTSTRSRSPLALEPGIFGPELERRLGAAGLTLGHFPQSFEFSTVGGWVATRSAGQASTGYGRIDELVEAVRCETPVGRAGHPRRARHRRRAVVAGAGRGLGGHARRDHRRHAARAPAAGGAPLRGLVVPQLRGGGRGAPAAGAGRARSPDVARLSDEDETRLSMALSSSGSLAERLGRGLPARCAATRTAASPSPASRAPPDDVARGAAAAPPRLLRAAGARVARAAAGAVLAARALRRALPARRAARTAA